MTAVLSSPVVPEVDVSTPPNGEESSTEGMSFMEVLATIPDPRKPRGIRHAFGPVLAVAVAAVVAGARSYRAIAHWANSAPQAVLEPLGMGGTVPEESTFRRCLQALAADGFDAALGAWMLGHTKKIGKFKVLAFDGKTCRGAKNNLGKLVHLMAGYSHHEGYVIAQAAVDTKTNEIPVLQAILETMRLEDTVITADAMHTQTDTAKTILERGGHYIFTAKGNQENLMKFCKELPWKDIPVFDTLEDKTHGRRSTWTLKIVTPETGLTFHGAKQVIEVTRHTRFANDDGTKAKRQRDETIYALTSLTAKQASAAQIADMIRGHWGIENRVHWVRDVTFDEDRSQVRTGSGPQVMATLRNLVISLALLQFSWVTRHALWAGWKCAVISGRFRSG